MIRTPDTGIFAVLFRGPGGRRGAFAEVEEPVSSPAGWLALPWRRTSRILEGRQSRAGCRRGSAERQKSGRSQGATSCLGFANVPIERVGRLPEAQEEAWRKRRVVDPLARYRRVDRSQCRDREIFASPPVRLPTCSSVFAFRIAPSSRSRSSTCSRVASLLV